MFLDGPQEPPEEDLPVEEIIHEANRLDGQGRFNEARGLYEHGIERHPDNAVLHYDFGVACAGQGQPELTARATGLYRRALELDPDYVEAHGNLAMLLMQAKDWSGARAHLEAAIRAQEGRAEPVTPPALLYQHLGLSLLFGGEPDAAQVALHTALGSNPDPATEESVRRILAMAGDSAPAPSEPRAPTGIEMNGGGMSIETEDGGDAAEPPGDGWTGPSGNPMQVMTADSVRQIAKPLAEAMGKTLVRAQMLIREGLDRRRVLFQCEDGDYAAVIDAAEVVIHRCEAGAPVGEPVCRLQKS